MADIIYKNYSNDEEEIYKRSIDTIRSNISNGVKFDLACEFLDVKDEELKRLIIDDALKIEIAESHYGKGLSLVDLSKKIGVSMERLLKANDEMIEDIINTSTNGFDQVQ